MEPTNTRLRYQKYAWAAIFSLLGALAVVLGAFGAHGLEDSIPEGSLDAYKTGVLYHFIHVVSALALILGNRDEPTLAYNIGVWSFLVGILLFSGSLYLLATADLTNLPTRFIGPITPVGGLFFIIGWISWATYFFQKRNH